MSKNGKHTKVIRRALIARVREQLTQIRSDLDLIANTLELLTRDDLEAEEALATRKVTAGGRVRDLRGAILHLLEESGKPMSSAELAEKLYSPELQISRDLFKRRVIVSVSAMYKKEEPPRVVPASVIALGHPKEWALPTWKSEGIVSKLEERLTSEVSSMRRAQLLAKTTKTRSHE